MDFRVVVAVKFHRGTVKLVLADIVLQLAELFHCVQVSERLAVPLEVVVDCEALSQRFLVKQVLQVRQVFLGVLLRLLRHQKCDVKVVQAKGGFVQSVDIC